MRDSKIRVDVGCGFFRVDYIDEKMFQSIKPDIEELIKLLVSSIKTAKQSK